MNDDLTIPSGALPQSAAAPPAPFEFVDEPVPADQLRALFRRFWPAYRRWFLREGDGARPTYADGLRALRKYMPELVGTYETLCALVGGGDLEARFLSLWKPTPFMTGCSQAIWLGEPLALVRNYDYAPHLCESIILRSAFSGTDITVMTDCFWGALDGMNAHGLAAALAFGGRKEVGEGFAIPLILRYLLETCATVEDAVAALRRVPSHMTYNISLVDSRGRHATVFVGPGRPVQVTDDLVCTNHQGSVAWQKHATLTRSVERERSLRAHVADPAETFEGLLAHFHAPPIFLTGGFRRWRTLYTAAYMPQRQRCLFRWPGAEFECHP